ncbi:MAG: YwiC-like family protein [Fidelibacterota bacterium]|nr:MAG: YwiC-like family protein [Candidatus Neomarinimicrobiota bacterium]
MGKEPSSTKRQLWVKPPLSAEHGASVTLAICFLMGAWIAGQWNLNTIIALITAFTAFELQVPLTRMIRRRRLELRLVTWALLYGLGAIVGAGTLWLHNPILGRIYAVAVGVLLINLIGAVQKDQKSIWNELAVFAGLCLALPFAYTATAGQMIRELLGLWLLCTLVLSSAIFTVRLRLLGDEVLAGAAAYHIAALAVVFLLVQLELLKPELAWTFLIPLVKLVLIILRLDEYQRLKMTKIGFLETGLAILFALLAGYLSRL